MKRLYPIFAAIVIASGAFVYILSGKSSGMSSDRHMSPSQTSSPSSSAIPSLTPTTSATALIDGEHTGMTVSTVYGDVQVALVVSGGKIIQVNVLKQPEAERRSVEINSSAIPQLKSEVLVAQSANIDAVSGATYTSDGFLQSLASALKS